MHILPVRLPVIAYDACSTNLTDGFISRSGLGISRFMHRALKAFWKPLSKFMCFFFSPKMSSSTWQVALSAIIVVVVIAFVMAVKANIDNLLCRYHPITERSPFILLKESSWWNSNSHCLQYPRYLCPPVFTTVYCCWNSSKRVEVEVEEAVW